jgi:hypothetical protein
MTIAKTILEQLGGNRFMVMTGARQLTAFNNGLAFKIGRNSSQANYVKIELTGMDLYDMTFSRVGKEIVVLHRDEGLYNDMLQDRFTKFTGMYTSL